MTSWGNSDEEVHYRYTSVQRYTYIYICIIHDYLYVSCSYFFDFFLESTVLTTLFLTTCLTFFGLYFFWQNQLCVEVGMSQIEIYIYT